MEHISNPESKTQAGETELIRRRGDRRVHDEAVPEERRKGDRRDIPGVTALIRTLFRHDSGTES